MGRTQKIAVNIVTGFLGTGKTTFINGILKKFPHLQFALVENEFGDIAIDTQLISGMDASQMFELRQGCICCSISDEYELVLEELAQRFPHVENLLIETTGVADPASVIAPFLGNVTLRELYHYAGTVCLYDAHTPIPHPEQELIEKQLALADHILINKTEHSKKTELQNIEKYIQQLNPLAAIDITSFAQSTFVPGQSTPVRSLLPHVQAPATHSHIQTQSQNFTKALPKEHFLRWLDYTLSIHRREIYRVKGILTFQNEPFEYILQGVSGNFELLEGDLITTEAESRLVFIGQLDNVDLSYLPG